MFSLRCASFRLLCLQDSTSTIYLLRICWLCTCLWYYKKVLACAHRNESERTIMSGNKISTTTTLESNTEPLNVCSVKHPPHVTRSVLKAVCCCPGAAAAGRCAGGGAVGLPARRRRRQVCRGGRGGGGVRRRSGGGAAPGPADGPGGRRRLPRRARRLPRACGCRCAPAASPACRNRMPLRPD